MTTPDDRRGCRFEHDGITIVYDDLGDRRAPAIVLLHGGTGSRDHWAPFAGQLAERFRVLPVDLRGHGDSDRAPGRYAVPDHGGDIAAFCREVAGGQPVLIGHSLGAIVSAYVAAVQPGMVRAAVLEDPPMFIIDPAVWPSTLYGMFFPMLRAAMLDAQSAADPEAALRDWLVSLPPMGERGTLADILGPEHVERQVRSWARCDPDVLGLVDDPAVDVATWRDHNVDTPITCPVLVLRADPQLMPAFLPEHEDRFRRLAPQATFALAEGAGHGIHDEQPQWFADQVEKFLAAL